MPETLHAPAATHVPVSPSGTIPAAHRTHTPFVYATQSPAATHVLR